MFSYSDGARPSGTVNQNNLSLSPSLKLFLSAMLVTETQTSHIQSTSKYVKHKVLKRPDPASLDPMVTIIGLLTRSF